MSNESDTCPLVPKGTKGIKPTKSNTVTKPKAVTKLSNIKRTNKNKETLDTINGTLPFKIFIKKVTKATVKKSKLTVLNQQSSTTNEILPFKIAIGKIKKGTVKKPTITKVKTTTKIGGKFSANLKPPVSKAKNVKSPKPSPSRK